MGFDRPPYLVLPMADEDAARSAGNPVQRFVQHPAKASVIAGSAGAQLGSHHSQGKPDRIPKLKAGHHPAEQDASGEDVAGAGCVLYGARDHVVPKLSLHDPMPVHPEEDGDR